MDDQAVVKKIKAKREAVERRRKLHAKNSEERAKTASDIKAAYQAAAGSTVLVDILAKAKAFCEYHTKVAKDGVGFNAEGGIVYHTNNKRISELDRAAGIQELVDYIERQLEEAPKPVVSGDPSDGEAEDDPVI